MHSDLLDRLQNISDALDRIFLRNEHIECENDYYTSPGGMEKLESTSMLLIAIGESLKGIDRITKGELLSMFPSVNWRQAKGLRDIIAHNYFQIDGAVILDTVRNDLPMMKSTILEIIQYVKNHQH